MSQDVIGTTSVAVANARQNVGAPTRKPRRFGLLSVVDLVDGGDSHWMLGGFTADGEECSTPSAVSIVCGPTAAKSPRSWYSDITSDPWVSYMYETCKSVGRFSESQSKLRTRFLAAEQSAVERGFQTSTLSKATALTGTPASVAQAIGALEGRAAQDYGGQIILHIPFFAFENANPGTFVRVGDHLETAAGNLVSVGNYDPALDGGSATAPVLYATGSTILYRGPLVESGATLNMGTNDYYTLIERAYGALVDCLLIRTTGALCAC